MKIDKGKTDEEGNPVTETITLEVPAQIVDGRTLVPARAISESFGLDVNWDEEDKNVIITSEDNDDELWKENTGSINLTDMTCDGDGIEITDNLIKITAGGDFTLTGTLEDGSITIATPERVRLRLSGAEITSTDGPCIFVEESDKAYITLTNDTENILVAENSEDGAIYSKENLEIKGDGSLDIKSSAGHGIKVSDNLSIENGSITINASNDGIHINDTFKMTDGIINITSEGDGIDSESIINISGGKINIETTATPVEATTEETESAEAADTEEAVKKAPRRGMWEEAADVELEKSSKGINAEWMMIISGSDININSASHTIHCQDELEINGGSFILNSKYDKGISAHGNLTISGADTTIDVLNSTEGIESKNVLTINDGNIKVISTDDAINATGGSSGMMMPGGNFGGGFAPPGRPGKNPQNTEDGQNEAQTQPRQRPQRNNRKPGDQTNKEFTPHEEKNENGEFTPPPFNNENGDFTPPPFNNENGEFTPPPFNNENGEFTLPAGNRPQPPNGGRGMGRNRKTCLIINGGYLELCGKDDCVDANGNMSINGGIIKATNPTGSFSGNFGVLDADGQITISENADIILAASNGNEKSLNLTQNSVIVYCENQHTEKEEILIYDADGNVVCQYAPEGSFKTVLIASDNLKTGEKYSVKISEEAFDIEILQQLTVAGTQPAAKNNGFGRRGGM